MDNYSDTEDYHRSAEPVLGEDASVEEEDRDFGEGLDGCVEEFVSPEVLEMSEMFGVESGVGYFVESLFIEGVDIPNMEAEAQLCSWYNCQSMRLLCRSG